MSNADWANKDFYKVLGVAKDADQATIKKAYRKLARENHPDSKPGRQGRGGPLQAGRRGLRRRRRHRRSARSTTRCARCSPGRVRRRVRRLPRRLRRAARGWHRGFDISDLFGDLFNRGGGGGGGFGRRTRTPQRRAGADVETETTLGLRRRDRRHHDQPAAELGRALPDVLGHRRQARHPAARLPTCEGAGVVVSSVGGGFSMNETCPECHGRQLVYDEACPTCHGSGRGLSSRTVSARIPAGVKDGQRIRLKGKGAAGENGGPAGDLLVTVHVAAAPALRPQGRQPHPRGAGDLRRGRARCRDQGARRSVAPGHPADPAGHPQRPGDAGARPRGAAQGRHARATCWSPSTSQVPDTPRRGHAGGGHGLPSSARQGADPRAALFEGGGVAVSPRSSRAARPRRASPARRCRST